MSDQNFPRCLPQFAGSGLLAAACLLAAVAPVHAATPAVAEVDQLIAVDIPAGPLSTTLMRIGQLSGRAIAADPALMTGRQASAIRGRMVAEQAVRQALAGSGLVVDTTASGAFSIRRAPAAAETAPVQALPEMTVTTSRIGSSLMAPTQSVTVIEDRELDDLRATSPNLGVLLSKAVPGLSDSSRNLTDFGQTLRGRTALVLVDGIPLNTNRDSSRNLVNIDPSRIARVEVLRGSSSLYGSGATGGIISVTTRPAGGEPVSETTVGADLSLSRPSREGMGGQVQHALSGGGEIVDYALDVSYRRIGGSYDARGHRIAPDASQGDLFDSDTYSVGGKVGLRIDADQRLQFAASYLRARQDTEYASDPAVARTALGTATARAIKGLDLARQNEVENTLASINYDHKDLLGSSLSALVYARDGATRFAPADLRSNVNRGNNIDQVMQNNKVFGARLTVDTPLGAAEKTRLVWGGDFIQERSNMPLDVFDPAIYDASGGLVFRTIGQKTYLPWTTTRSIGLFGQLQHKFNDQWSAEGGVRYEKASASFDAFQPLSQSRVSNPATVPGGRVSYDAVMYNAGLTFKPVKGHELYASFSQGFDLPDVGLQLRNAGARFDINASDLQAVKTDNFELGWRGRFASTMASVSLFRSQSDLGGVQSFNNGLILTRTSERIHGVEATLDYYGDDDAWSAGGTLTWMTGKETPPATGVSQKMTGYRIPPLKITAYGQYRHTPRWHSRVQVTWFGARDYRLADGRTQFARADVHSYYTVDLVTRYELDKRNSFTVGVQNLFNKYYLPLYSQLLRSGNNNSRLPAAGAVLTATYSHRW